MSNPSLSKSALKAWQVNAQTWDKGATIDGNIYWKRLQQPCLERLVGPRLTRQGDVTCNVLELSTGNGICARWMAGHGGDNIKIYATDGSAPMVETAIAHGTADGKIQFDVLDVTEKTDFDPFLELANKIDGFDVILSNMAIQDIATLEPMAEMLPKLLKKDGIFVAELLHPVFSTSIFSREISIGLSPVTNQFETSRGKLIKEYLHVEPYQDSTILGDKMPQTFFHRPLHELFSTFFKNGLVMDALEEPAFTVEDAEPQRLHSSRNFNQLPSLLAFRLRRMS